MAATIPAVDPHAKRGLVRRAFYSFGQSKAGRWYGIKIGSRIDIAALATATSSLPK